jgi:hypothetical protein
MDVSGRHTVTRMVRCWSRLRGDCSFQPDECQCRRLRHGHGMAGFRCEALGSAGAARDEGRPQMRRALQHFPVAVTGYGGDLRDVQYFGQDWRLRRAGCWPRGADHGNRHRPEGNLVIDGMTRHRECARSRKVHMSACAREVFVHKISPMLLTCSAYSCTEQRVIVCARSRFSLEIYRKIHAISTT